MLNKIEKSIFLTKPLIGIVGRRIDDIYKVNKNIVLKIIECGGIPILILPTNFNDLKNVLDMCDGIVMPGGKDIYYYDRYICRYAIDNDVPLLGICLGMQIMAHNYLKKLKVNHQGVMHKIVTKKGSIINRIIGDTCVNSRHEEHITNPGEYIATAYSLDGTIEAIEHPFNKFNVGVQWHPEDMDDNSLFLEFIRMCKCKVRDR